MSYPNYHSSASRLTRPQVYDSSREPVNVVNTYEDQMRSYGRHTPSQHPPSTYDWTSQNRAPNARHTPLNHANHAWRDGPGGQPEYANHTNYYSPAVSSVAPSSFRQSSVRNDYRQDAQGLNHLAYASSLKPANTRQEVMGDINGTIYDTRYSQRQSTVSEHRSQSPNIDHPRSVQQTAALPMREAPDSMSSHQMAVNAAAALADAVKSRQVMTQPSISIVQSLPGTSSSIGNDQQPQKMPTQRPANTFAPSRGHEATPRIETSAVQLPVQASDSNLQARLPVLSQELQKQSRQSQNSIQQTNSIANLVGVPDTDVQSQPEGISRPDQTPYYINPAQIFNPYYREHERRRKEGSDAEAKRREEEEQRKIADDTERGDKGSSYKSQDSATANSKSKVIRKPTVIAPEGLREVSDLPSEQDKMALEMKMMMERMRSFRSKDPSLFQKLWNEMRGKDSSASHTTSGTQQSPSPQDNRAALPVTSAVSPQASPAAQVSQPLHASKESQAAQEPQASQAPQVSQATQVSQPPRTSMNQTQSILASTPANGYRVVVLTNHEELLDLGRFPAERRIRHPHKNKGSLSTDQSGQISRSQPQRGKTPTKLPDPGIPAQPSDSAAIWPESRRRAVANAAMHLLMSVPENANHKITTEDIAAMLEQNPSYTDLCAGFEMKGLVFQRTAFARDLLRHVPDLNRGSGVRPLAPEQNVPTSGATQLGPVRAEIGATAFSKHEPAPGTKEAAARKRDFSELIDYTQINGDEDYVIAIKKPRLEHESESTVLHGSSNLKSSQAADGWKSVSDGQFTSLRSNGLEPLRFETHARPFDTSNPQEVRSNAQPAGLVSSNKSSRPRLVLAQKIDRAEALQKTYYDSRTVARDVLIASGRHPYERPLNIHLAGMLQVYIDLDSDVSTIDWDAIDPGGAPPTKVSVTDLPAVPPRYKWDAKRRRYQLGESIAKSQLPSHETSRSTRPGDTIRANNSDQREESSRAKVKHSDVDLSPSLAGRENTASSLRVTSRKHQLSVDIPVPRHFLRSPSRQRQGPAEVTRTSTNTPTVVNKRRGRPPGSTNRYPSIAAMKEQAAAVSEERPSIDNGADLPVMPVYRCRWVKCAAELHNMETLKRHILKKHAPSKDEAKAFYVCWWKKCHFLARDEDGSIGPSKSFHGEKDWLRHIETDHLQLIGLKYGSGPQAIFYDPQKLIRMREQFLHDEYGCIATPAIGIDGGTDLPPDVLELTRVYSEEGRIAKERAQTAFLKAHGNKAHDHRKRAEEIVRAMAVRKQKIGPGIDRGGCTLINEARRATFMQNPGIFRIIEAEY